MNSYVNKKSEFYIRYIKRPADFILSLIMLLCLSPVLLILCILVRIKLGSPVIFSQERPGKDGKIFKLMKFRSMTEKKDEKGELLPDEERLTSFGKRLRSTSLDELPELINIFKGEMSFVGPRPLLVRYLPRYTKEQMHRHDVLPGLTGLAQVNGRNALTWEKKFDYDLEYVRNISLSLDIKIFFMTFMKVFKREGVSSGTSATMEEFFGTEGNDTSRKEK